MINFLFSRNRSSSLSALLIAYLIVLTGLWTLEGLAAVAWVWTLSFILIFMLNVVFNTGRKLEKSGYTTYDHPGDRVCPASIVTSVLIFVVAGIGTSLVLGANGDFGPHLFSLVFLHEVLIISLLPKRLWNLTSHPV